MYLGISSFYYTFVSCLRSWKCKYVEIQVFGISKDIPVGLIRVIRDKFNEPRHVANSFYNKLCWMWYGIIWITNTMSDTTTTSTRECVCPCNSAVPNIKESYSLQPCVQSCHHTAALPELLSLSYLSYDKKKTFAQITIRIALFEIRLLIGSSALGGIEFLVCCSLESTSQCNKLHVIMLNIISNG